MPRLPNLARLRAPLVALVCFAMTSSARSDNPRTAPARAPGARRPGAARSARPPAPGLLPFKAVEKTLPNGLKVIVVPTGFPNIVSLQIPVQTGSRNEIEPGKSGFAHFFEHMMFRGTEEYPPEKYQAVLSAAGARQNAYTTDDFTNYHTTFVKEDLETILRLEADRFQHLSYAEPAFKTEARAVLGEYNKNSADPITKLIEVQRERAFTTHTYQHTTMGFLPDIENMPNQYAYAQTFFDRWYRPEYATVMVAGDVSAEEVLPLVQKYWGSWKRGNYKVEVPAEPEPRAPVYAHVPWPSDTLPWVTVAFHGPAFSETDKDYAATDLLLDLTFGPTSELYKRLLDDEQKVDQLFPFASASADPSLVTVAARVKRMEDAVYVRDEILRAVARVRAAAPEARRVDEAKSNARYSLLRSLDNTDRIAAILARFVRFRRSYDTLNEYFRLYDTLAPADLLRAARKYLTDQRLVVTTLSAQPMPAAMDVFPLLESLLPPTTSAGPLKRITVPSALPQLDVKLLFRAGSAHDPAGKEGLAALSAAMIAEAGSRKQRIDEIRQALFPIAGRFDAQVDKEMTVFTLGAHRDNWDRFAAVVLPMLLEPGFREEDFRRLKDMQKSALVEDLRGSNEEELAKERLQANLFAGTPYGHTALGTVAGIEAITLDDVKAFVARSYTRGNLVLGLAGEAPPDFAARLERDLAALPAGGPLPAASGLAAHRPHGLEVEIVQKETRATSISLGHPIEVTRSHPDFPALWLARAWLGEHRSSMGRLFQRIREVRGMNYGDYAYIEAFPRGMFQFAPDPNLGRRAQIFELWIRPVAPENAHMALRLALFELRSLIDKGLTPEQFTTTRDYLRKSLFLLTATQDQQLGYALDSDWYGIGEFTSYMRDALSRLTVDEVNRAIRKHLSASDLSIVMVTKDAPWMREGLLADEVTAVHYDAPRPPDVLEEDKVVGASKLGLVPEAVRITPVDEVFAR